MKVRTLALALSTLCGLSCGGCLADKEYVENECTPRKTTAALLTNAEARAKQAYVPQAVVTCAPLDRPLDGDKFAQGIVFEEYAGLISGSAGNFLDNGTWWGKALPRGELHVHPTQLYDENCSPLSYEQFEYDYSATLPPVNAVPECGRDLVGLSVGHRFFQSHPQVLELDATAYARLVPLRLNAIFGTSFRFATENAAYEGETFPVMHHIHVLEHDEDSLSFAASLSGETFEGSMQAELVPGATTELHVEATLYPRVGLLKESRLGVLGMSSMFWKRDIETPEFADDEAHDSDEFVVDFADGGQQVIGLENPAPSEAPDGWVRYTFSGRDLSGVSLRQTERDQRRYMAYQSARYAERPTISVQSIESNLPLAAELSVSPADTEYIDNVVVNVFVDTSARHDTPVHIRYVLAAIPD